MSFEAPSQGQLKVIEFEATRLLSIIGIQKVGHAANNPTATRIIQASLPIDKPAFVNATDKTRIPVIELSKYDDDPSFANWRVALKYGMQDESALRLAIISEVPELGHGYYHGITEAWPSTEAPLSRSQADNIIADLDSLQAPM